MKEKLILFLLTVLSVALLLSASAVYVLISIFLGSRFDYGSLLYIIIGIAVAIIGFLVYVIIENLTCKHTKISRTSLISATLILPTVLSSARLIYCRISGIDEYLLSSCSLVLCFSILLMLCLRHFINFLR